MQLSIRSVVESDAESIISILNPIISAGVYTVMDEPITLKSQTEFLRTFPEQGIFHVAITDDNKVVGLQDVIPVKVDSDLFNHIGEISTFVKLESFRQSIGSTLSGKTFNIAKEKGFHKLRATVRVDNEVAISFYKNQGFTDFLWG